MLVYGGVLHYSRGAPEWDWPAIWRWHADHFERVDRPTALGMNETYRYISELLEREGWSNKEFWDMESGTSFRSAVDDVELEVNVELILDSKGFEQARRVTLKQLPRYPQELLLETNNSPRFLWWQEYRELEAWGPAQSAAQWPGR